MASIWNQRISISIFGEAEGPAVGVVIDNLPPGEYIDTTELAQFLSRRTPRPDGTTTAKEDLMQPQILSGIFSKRTSGTPLCAFLNNNTAELNMEDYSNLSKIARPGHADYTGAMRYRGFADLRGGGHSSAKLTACLCFAGAVCGQILERRGIYVGAHIVQIHNIKDKTYDRTNVTREDILETRYKAFPTLSDAKGRRMQEDIQKAKEGGESLGGIIECAAIGVPAGIGSPIFDGLENTIAQLIFGIPGVKGLEFGAGFQTAKMTGSQNNDTFYVDDAGHIKTKTNNHGGILGGISSGMPITLNVAIKPTASIPQPQETVDYSALRNEVVNVGTGESCDPCIVPLAVPCIEAAVNIAILSHMLDFPHFT